MILGRREILRELEAGRLVIKPLSEDSVRENGVDLRAGSEYARLKPCGVAQASQPIPVAYLHPRDAETRAFKLLCVERLHAGDGDWITLAPNSTYLLHTMEWIRLPENMVGFVNLRSTWARMGLMAPPTVVDAGFEGELVIEARTGPIPLRLRPGERFIHLVLAYTASPTTPYRGKYQGQAGVRHAAPD